MSTVSTQYIQQNKPGKCNGQATYLHITVTHEWQWQRHDKDNT